MGHDHKELSMRLSLKTVGIIGFSFIAGATCHSLLQSHTAKAETEHAQLLTSEGLQKQVRLLTNIKSNPSALAGAISALMVNVDGRREEGELAFVEATFGKATFTVPGQPLPGQKSLIAPELAARLGELDQVQMRQAYEWYSGVLQQYSATTKEPLLIKDVGYAVGALVYLTKEAPQANSHELLSDLTKAWVEQDFQLKDPEANRLDRRIRETIGAAYAFGGKYMGGEDK